MTLLSQCSMYISGNKVRSRALLFLYRLFFQTVYHAFYRNLVSLLRLIKTAILIASLHVSVHPRSSLPSSFCPQRLSWWSFPTNDKTVASGPASGRRQSSAYEEHIEAIASSFYVRGLAQNITMVGFLGWLSILHFGPNRRM